MQVVVARLLARPLAKALSWPELLSSFAVALLLVWWSGRDTGAGPDGMVFALRLGALCLAAGMAFVLDDPTEDSTSNTPVSLLLRRAVRIALTLPGTLIVWLLLIRIANGSPSVTSDIPVWPFSVELLAFSAVALAGAAVGSRHLGDRLGGTIGAGAPLLMAAAAALLPGRLRLWEQMPGTSGYAGATRWWWAIVLAAGLVLVHYSRVGARSFARWLGDMMRRGPVASRVSASP